MSQIQSSINVICLESEAFYQLVQKVIDQIKEDHNDPKENRWISDHEAMSHLRIKSRSTLQQYRDEGKIRFSQPSRKIILYGRESIYDFINEHVKQTF